MATKAKQIEEVPVVEATDEIAVPTVVEETNESGVQLSSTAIIKNLIANGAKKYTAKIRNVTVTKKVNVNNEDYGMISFTLDRKVPRFIENDEGVYEEKMSNIIFTTHIGVNASLKERSDTGIYVATLIKEAIESPNEDKLKRIVLLLGGAKVEFIQQLVPADTEYINPFTQVEDPEANIFEHDTYVTHITNIELGVMGQNALMISMQSVMV